MKRLITFVLIVCVAAFCANAFGQQKDPKVNEKKGGFAVGGYDNAKQQDQPVRKRSVIINDEAEAQEKAAEAVPQPEAAPAPPPPPQPAAKAIPAEKEGQGNAYGKDKAVTEGKEFGQTHSQNSKDKQKPKKNKTKGTRR